MLSIDNTKDIKEVYIEFPNLNLEMDYHEPLPSPARGPRTARGSIQEVKLALGYRSKLDKGHNGYYIYANLFVRIFII